MNPERRSRIQATGLNAKDSVLFHAYSLGYITSGALAATDAFFIVTKPAIKEVFIGAALLKTTVFFKRAADRAIVKYHNRRQQI